MKLFTMEKEGKILAKVASHPKAKPIKQKLCDNEQEAQQFFQEVKTTLKQNKKKRNHIKKLFEDMSFQEMAQYVQQEEQSNTQPKFAKRVLKQTIEDTNSEIIFFFAEAKEMGVEEAFDYLYSKIGSTFTEMYQNALSGKLDTVYQELDEIAEDFMNEQYQMDTSGVISLECTHQGSETAEYILNVLNTIPGNKMVTITTDLTDYGAQTFDINAEGKVGYAPSHLNLFYEQIDQSLETTGSMIVRQFIPNSSEKKLINGKEIMIPHKALYGLIMHEGEIIPVSAEEVERSFETDYNTGEKLPMEEMILYRDISEFFK